VEVNDDKEYAARIFAQPFADSESFALRGLGIGIAGSWTSQEGTTTQTLLRQYRTPAQSTFYKYRADAVATGDRVRIAPQFYYYVGPLRTARRVDRGFAGCGAPERTRRRAHRHGRHDRVAVAGLAVPDRRGGSVRGYKPQSAFVPANGTWADWSSSLITPSSKSMTRHSRVAPTSFCRPVGVGKQREHDRLSVSTGT
jgi:phosphate-selective porin OprO/OprP